MLGLASNSHASIQRGFLPGSSVTSPLLRTVASLMDYSGYPAGPSLLQVDGILGKDLAAKLLRIFVLGQGIENMFYLKDRMSVMPQILSPGFRHPWEK